MRSGRYKQRSEVYRGRWQTIRKRILARDQYQCQINLPGCTLEATTVDHITPIAWGGEWYDPSNLRAACTFCNSNLGAIAKKHKPKRPTNRTTDPPPPQDPSRTW